MHYIELEIAYQVIYNKLELTKDQIQTKTRKGPIVQARQIMFYMLTSYNSVKYTQETIVKLFPCMGSHSTISHSLAKVRILLEYDKNFKALYDIVNDEFIKLMVGRSYSTFDLTMTLNKIDIIMDELNKLKLQLTQLDT